MDFLKTSMIISSSGLQAQSERLKVISENIANAKSTGLEPGAEPYRRKTIYFANLLDRKLGANKLEVRKIGRDKSDFILKYDPVHIAADERGYVKMPNVNPIIERADAKEAERSYEANLAMIKIAKAMLNKTMELLQ